MTTGALVITLILMGGVAYWCAHHRGAHNAGLIFAAFFGLMCGTTAWGSHLQDGITHVIASFT